MADLENKMDLQMRFEDKNGAIYVELYDKDGNCVYTGDKWLTNSLDSLDFTRDTKREIKVWGADGTLLETLAQGSLAPYWDAAQAAKETLVGGMTQLEVLKGCAAALGKVKMPMELLEDAIPIRAVLNTLKDVIKAMEKDREKQSKAAGQEDQDA